MARFAIGRLASMILVLFAISIATFAIFNVIPNGDPAARMAGREASDAEIEIIREEWGFDEPVYAQYATAMGKVVTGDVESYFTDSNVYDEIGRGLPRTLSLAFGAAVLWMVLGVGLGVLGALRAGRTTDRVLGALALVGLSMPAFWLGALLSHYLGFKANLFPNGGYVGFFDNPADWLWHLVLPWATLSLLFVGVYSRVVRASVLDAAGQDYVRAARAKGITERRVVTRHVLRTSLTGVVALWGLDVGAVLGGGAILTETVFDLGGVGQYAAQSIDDLDQPAVLVVTLLAAFFIVAFNALTDIAQAKLDPRVRGEEGPA